MGGGQRLFHSISRIGNIRRGLLSPRVARLANRLAGILAACSTVIRGLVTEVRLEPEEEPIPLPSVVQLDSTFNVSGVHLTSRLGRLSGERMHRVCAALSAVVDCR